MVQGERQAYRIDDLLELDHRLATTDEINNLNLFDHNRHLMHSLQIIDQDLIPLRNLIFSENKNIAAYLKLIENKIKIIAEAFAHNGQLAVQKKLQKVNISETGIAFYTKTYYKIGDTLKLNIILPPMFQDILSLAKVVKIIEQKNNSANMIAVHFTTITDIDRQTLSKYIISKQAERLRNDC